MPEPDAAAAPRPAPLLRRGLQLAVDLVLVGAVCAAPLALLLAVPRNPDGDVPALAALAILAGAALAAVPISWWYWVRRPGRRGGRTYGMQLLGLRVTDLSGHPASSGQLAIRWLLLLVDLFLFGAVGLASALLTRSRQRVGDVLAETVVVGPDRVPAT